MAEVVSQPRRRTGRSRLNTSWRVVIALLPATAVLLSERSDWPIDAAMALFLLLLLSIMWLIRTVLREPGMDDAKSKTGANRDGREQYCQTTNVMHQRSLQHW